MTMTAEPFGADPRDGAQGRKRAARVPETIKVWGHSQILYWWVVWVWGYGCAGVTWAYGQVVDLDDYGLGAAAFTVHPNPWVGASFLLVTLAVILFSAFRVKSYMVVLVSLVLAVAFLVLERSDLNVTIPYSVTLPPIFMSFGFYISISTVLMIFWVVAVFILDRLTYWRFSKGHAEQINFNYVENQTFSTTLMNVRSRPVDVLRIVLGLGQVRDVVLSFSAGSQKVEFVIMNAWRVDRKLSQIRALNSARS